MESGKHQKSQSCHFDKFFEQFSEIPDTHQFGKLVKCHMSSMCITMRQLKNEKSGALRPAEYWNL